jgi:hypothetical protein
MIPILATINLVVCFLGIGVGLWAIRSGKPMLLPIYLVVYIITNGIGMSFAFIPAFNQLVWRSMYETMVTDQDYLALCLATWIFIAIASVLILQTVKRIRYSFSLPLELPSDVAISLSILLLGVSIALYSKFMLFGPGLDLVRNTSYFHYSTDAAYQYRGELDATVTQGQGLLMATVASFCLFPLAAFFAIVSRRAQGVTLAVGGISSVCSFAFAFSLRQKAPVILMLLLYSLTYLHFFRGALLKAIISRLSDRRMILLGVVGFLSMLTVFYQITEGETVAEGLIHTVYRIFIIPVASNQAWFTVFPEVFPFRGMIGIIDTIFFDASRGAVGVPEIAEVISGYEFSLNAAMLAVAWSAGGYLGVILISAIFCVTATAIDRGMAKLSPALLFPIVIISLPSLLSLTSTSFFDFLVKGGFFSPLAIAGSYLLFGRHRQLALLKMRRGSPEGGAHLNVRSS